MARRILVDTDVLIDFLRGNEHAVAFVRKHADWIMLSPIVVAELFAGARNDAERATLDDFVTLFPVAPMTVQVAKVAGSLRREFGKSHGVGLADAIVAATALAEDAELKTINIKHYPMLKGLKPAYART